MAAGIVISISAGLIADSSTLNQSPEMMDNFNFLWAVEINYQK
jgi:hypothetical protein